MSYTIKELARDAGVNEKTCLRWIEQGLPTLLGGKKPILMRGSDIKEFLRKMNSKKKIKLKRHEFYCLKCKAARSAKRGSIKKLKGRKTGECRVCSGKMSRTI
jgi:hypothetical protein